uniref:Uncharacterized protein n=1 Tax=Anguilla anguilla TaxID=7936 RepID=A0A0E9XUB2_ANGAN
MGIIRHGHPTCDPSDQGGPGLQGSRS